MVVIFSSTTTLLSTDFVKRFPQELLHAQLYRVGQETGVKFTRNKKTFTIVGAWESMQIAYTKLKEILDGPDLVSDVGNVPVNVPEIPRPIVKGPEGEDLPEESDKGTDEADSSKSDKSSIPKPMVYFQYADTRFMTRDVLNPEILNRALENRMKGRPLLENRPSPHDSSALQPTNNVKKTQEEEEPTVSDLDFSGPDDFDVDSDHEEVSKTENDKTVQPEETEQTKMEEPMKMESEDAIPIKNENGENVDEIEEKKTKQRKEIEEVTDPDQIVHLEEVGDEVAASDPEYTEIVKEEEEAPPATRLRSSARKKKVLVRSRKKGCARRKAKKPIKYIAKEGDEDIDEEPSGADGDDEKAKTAGSKKKRIRIRAAKKPKRVKKGRKADEKGVFPCTECNYVGYKRKHITEHVARKHRREVVNCEICGNSFGFQKDLNRHKKNVHSEPAHFCDVCERFYKNRRVYEEHMKTHTEGYIKPSFTCQICGKSFSTKYVLATHIKAEHLGMKKTYLCPTCGKSFTQRNSYRQHANVHAGIRPHVCDICGMSFTYDKSLKEHKYMHENIRRFQCNICSKAFKQSTSLRIHMKVHSDTKEHMCSACGKGFTQKQALLRHERIHNGDKPYTCGLCRRTFNDTSIIRRHMLLIHKKDPKRWRDDVISDVKRHTEYFIQGGPGDTGKKRKPYQPTEIIDGPAETSATTTTTTTTATVTTAEEIVAQSPVDIEQQQQQQQQQQAVFPVALLHSATALPQDTSPQGMHMSKPRNDQMIAPPPPPPPPLQQHQAQQHQQKPQPPQPIAMPINYSCQQTYPGEIQTSTDNPQQQQQQQQQQQAHQPFLNHRPDPQRDLFSPLIQFTPLPNASGHVTVTHNEPLRHNQMAYPPVTSNTDMGQPNPWSYPGYPPFYLPSTYPDPTGFHH